MNRKNRRRILAGGILFCAIYVGWMIPGAFAAETAPAQQESTAETKAAPKVKEGLVEENGKIFYYKKGKKLKKTWKTISQKVNGKKVKNRYYFGKNGAACTSVLKWKKNYYTFSETGVLNKSSKNKLFQVGGTLYCPDADGVCQKGWLIVGKKLYYADRKGRIVTNQKIVGIQLKRNGAAKNSTATRLKILALQTVAKKTSPSMTKAQKLRACWNYLVSKRYFTYSYRDPDVDKKGWQKGFAYQMLRTRRGSCESFACAFAALACAIGYDPIIYYGRVPGSRDRAADGFTRHCWVKIDGEYYDPEAQFAGWMKGVYGDSSYPIRHKVLKTFHFE